MMHGQCQSGVEILIARRKKSEEKLWRAVLWLRVQGVLFVSKFLVPELLAIESNKEMKEIKINP